jgi:hypothetical protein
MSEQDISWTPLLENYFKKSAEKAQCYAWLYNHAETIYSRRRTYIDMPVNIISALVGFFSVGSDMMFNGETRLSSISLGIASLLAGIMNSTKSYFGWTQKAEGCKISSVHYGKLYRFIVVELGLPRHERMRANDFLKYVKDSYDRLAETSYPLPPESIDAFKKRFSTEKYNHISKPEIANGLEQVKIYDDKLTIRIPVQTPEEPTLREPSIRRAELSATEARRESELSATEARRESELSATEARRESESDASNTSTSSLS